VLFVVDIDECTRADICPANSVCTNSPGSYLCDCENGYRKVEDRCVKIGKYDDV